MLDGMSQTDLDQMFEDELIDPEIKVNPFAKFEVEDTFGNVEVIDPKNTDDAESDTIDTADYPDES